MQVRQSFGTPNLGVDARTDGLLFLQQSLGRAGQ